MAIIGGFDLHRRQLTYDYLDVVTGQVDRGRVVPADRGQLGSFLARFQGQGEVAFAVEAAPAGATWWRSWSGPASGPSWPSRRRRLPNAAQSAAPRPTGPTPATCESCWARATCPSRGSRRCRCLRPGRGCGCIRTWRRSARRGCSGSRPPCTTRACRSSPPAAGSAHRRAGPAARRPGPLLPPPAGLPGAADHALWDRPDHLGGDLGRDGRHPPLLVLR